MGLEITLISKRKYSTSTNLRGSLQVLYSNNKKWVFFLFFFHENKMPTWLLLFLVFLTGSFRSITLQAIYRKKKKKRKSWYKRKSDALWVVCDEAYLIWCDWGTPTFGAWRRPGQWLCFLFLPASAHCGLWPFNEEIRMVLIYEFYFLKLVAGTLNFLIIFKIFDLCLWRELSGSSCCYYYYVSSSEINRASSWTVFSPRTEEWTFQMKIGC